MPSSRRSPPATESTPLQAAMRLLARRAHGRAELTAKLRQRGFASDAIETAIDRALELGLTESDEAVAERYARELAARSGATPRWVRQKLATRGLPRDAIQLAVERAFEDWDPRRAALELVAGEENIPRAARRLERKGFSADVIGWTVRRLQADHQET